MTLIEITLLIIVLILIVVLINQDILTNIFVSQHNKNKAKISILIKLFKKAYGLFKKAKKLSFVYIFKNKFYKFYLIIAISIVLAKIFIHYNPQAINNLPIWIGKSIDFLIVSSAWEIACVITKIIDEKASKR